MSRARIRTMISLAALCVAVGAQVVLPRREPVRAAQPVFQAPELVWETEGRTAGPQIAVDAAGGAHLFFLDTRGDGADITLFHVDLDRGAPFEPNDVLVAIGPDFRDYRVAADPFGNIHVLFVRQNVLWHTLVPGSEASDAGSWSAPVSLGGANPGAELAIDGGGRVYVCFPRGSAVRLISSDDGGASWGQDQLVAGTAFPAIPVYLACAVDTEGAIHVAWAEAAPPSFYPSKGTWITRSDDDGDTWDVPERVAGEHYTLPELLADAAGNVHLLWQADVGLGGRQYRVGSAGEERAWSETETVVPVGSGGMSGDAPLAVDGGGNAHVVTSAPEPVWVGRGVGGWGAPVPLAESLASEPNATGSIEHPAFGISNGNVAHVAFEFDFKRIYYVAGILDAPEVRATPMPLPAAMARQPQVAAVVEEPRAATTSTAEAEPTADSIRATAVASPMLESGGAAWLNESGTGWLRWFGPLLALILVAGVTWRQLAHR